MSRNDRNEDVSLIRLLGAGLVLCNAVQSGRGGNVLQKCAVVAIAAILGISNSKSSFAATFDGVYKGTMDLNTSVENNPQCAKTWVSTLEVKDNRMSLTTDIKPVTLYEIYVGADGKFDGKANATGDGQWRTFTGAIAGSNVAGQFYNQYCHYTLSFKKAQ